MDNLKMDENELNKGKVEVINLLKTNDLILESRNFTSMQIAHLLDKLNFIDRESMASFATIGMFEDYIKPILDGLIDDGKIKKIGDDIYNLN